MSMNAITVLTAPNKDIKKGNLPEKLTAKGVVTEQLNDGRVKLQVKNYTVMVKLLEGVLKENDKILFSKNGEAISIELLGKEGSGAGEKGATISTVSQKIELSDKNLLSLLSSPKDLKTLLTMLQQTKDTLFLGDKATGNLIDTITKNLSSIKELLAQGKGSVESLLQTVKQDLAQLLSPTTVNKTTEVGGVAKSILSLVGFLNKYGEHNEGYTLKSSQMTSNTGGTPQPMVISKESVQQIIQKVTGVPITVDQVDQAFKAGNSALLSLSKDDLSMIQKEIFPKISLTRLIGSEKPSEQNFFTVRYVPHKGSFSITPVSQQEMFHLVQSGIEKSSSSVIKEMPQQVMNSFLQEEKIILPRSFNMIDKTFQQLDGSAQRQYFSPTIDPMVIKSTSNNPSLNTLLGQSNSGGVSTVGIAKKEQPLIIKESLPQLYKEPQFQEKIQSFISHFSKNSEISARAFHSLFLTPPTKELELLPKVLQMVLEDPQLDKKLSEFVSQRGEKGPEDIKKEINTLSNALQESYRGESIKNIPSKLGLFSESMLKNIIIDGNSSPIPLEHTLKQRLFSALQVLESFIPQSGVKGIEKGVSRTVNLDPVALQSLEKELREKSVVEGKNATTVEGQEKIINQASRLLERVIKYMDDLTILPKINFVGEQQSQFIALPLKFGNQWTEVGMKFKKRKRLDNKDDHVNVALHVSFSQTGPVSVSLDHFKKDGLYIQFEFAKDTIRQWFVNHSEKLQEALTQSSIPVKAIIYRLQTEEKVDFAKIVQRRSVDNSDDDSVDIRG